jgi:hypothetical protein
MLSEPIKLSLINQKKSLLNLLKNVHLHSELILVVKISVVLMNDVAFYINKKRNLLVCLTETVPRPQNVHLKLCKDI